MKKAGIAQPGRAPEPQGEEFEPRNVEDSSGLSEKKNSGGLVTRHYLFEAIIDLL